MSEPKLKIGDRIRTKMETDGLTYKAGECMVIELLSPDSVAFANDLIELGRWEKDDDETTEQSKCTNQPEKINPCDAASRAMNW